MTRKPLTEQQVRTMFAAKDAARQCRHCAKFATVGRCSAATHLECDCPKCQGFCTCP